jgi:hypothetical protein
LRSEILSDRTQDKVREELLFPQAAVPAINVDEVVMQGKIGVLLEKIEECAGARLTLRSMYKIMHEKFPEGRCVPARDSADIRKAIERAFPMARSYDSQKADEFGEVGKGFLNLRPK